MDINNLSKLKVPELKKELENRGFTKTAGLLKADLIEKLKSLLENENNSTTTNTTTSHTTTNNDMQPTQSIINNEQLDQNQQKQINKDNHDNKDNNKDNNDIQNIPPPPPSEELPPPPPPSTNNTNENSIKMDVDIENKIIKEKVKEIFKSKEIEDEEKDKEEKVKNMLTENKNNEQIIIKPKEDIILSSTNNNSNNNSNNNKNNNDTNNDNNKNNINEEKKRRIDDDNDDDFDIATYKLKKKQIKTRKDCPYLDTVNRDVLDFDFEKVCSVSFHNHNVYACLVCGKYFQGKSQDSHANYHCLQMDHHVFINLKTQQIYCLPDDYEVIDSSLDDIKYLLNPTFTNEQIKELDSNTKLSRALDDSKYLPGIVGLNNIKNTAYVNVIIQSLARIPTIRNFLLNVDNIKNNKSPLVQTLSELLRKIWNPKNFKAQVSPHELLQAIQNSSQKRFNIRESSDPLDFLPWFLNALHKDLGGTKQPNSSIIYKAFSGEIQVSTDKPIPKSLDDEDDSSDDDNDNKMKEDVENKKSKIKYSNSISKQPFLFLTLDLPPKPVFKDDQDKSIIPQIPLFNLLAKYDGTTETILPNGEIKKYEILSLPKYLILCVKRFSKNNFFVEKEPTIVNFPIKNLDLNDYLPPGSPKSKFNLLATIKHEGDPNSGNYSVYINHKGNDKWFEMHDLSIKETMPQLIAVSECFFLIYEKIN
ncbi:hypothetical protein ACTFIV_005672 [Dictyostelium citrinum]